MPWSTRLSIADWTVDLAQPLNFERRASPGSQRKLVQLTWSRRREPTALAAAEIGARAITPSAMILSGGALPGRRSCSLSWSIARGSGYAVDPMPTCRACPQLPGPQWSDQVVDCAIDPLCDGVRSSTLSDGLNARLDSIGRYFVGTDSPAPKPEGRAADAQGDIRCDPAWA